MILSILTGVCIAGAAVLLSAAVLTWLGEKGVFPGARLVSRFRRLPMPAQFLLLVFAVNLIVYGSVKGPGVGGSATNAPSMSPLLLPSATAGFESGFSTNEIGSGYAVWRVGTNECWNFAPPPGAVEVSTWKRRGAFVDRQALPEAGAAFGVTCDGGLLVGDLADPVVRFSALGLPTALVPEANWGSLSSAARPSVAWHATTSWDSLLMTWRNLFLCRDTNTPVSVQVEVDVEGDVICHYDLSQAGAAVTNGVASVSSNGFTVAAGLGTNVTSVLFYRLRPEDLESADRDGDGLTTFDEVSVYHCDPGLVDSDGDGILDGDEVLAGTDPSVRSVPNEEIVERISGSPTNELYRLSTDDPVLSQTSIKLWDGFAADWPEGRTNLVYERTLQLGDASGWQHYFLSSLPGAAGGWDLRGLVLEWDDGVSSGELRASPRGDSAYLPLTNGTACVTIRLRAVDAKVWAPKPMFLVGYSPVAAFSGGQTVSDGYNKAIVVSGVLPASVSVDVDRPGRPCKAPLFEAERRLPGLEDIARASGGMVRYSGDSGGGTLTVSCPGTCRLPDMDIDSPYSPQPLPLRSGGGGEDWIVVIDPSVSFGDEHAYEESHLSYEADSGEYLLWRDYPLDSRCLWQSWHKSVDGMHLCDCTPKVESGVESVWFVMTDYTVEGNTATGFVYVFGALVWNDTAEHARRDAGGSARRTGTRYLSRDDTCDEPCAGSCEDGSCDSDDGTSLGSVKFRVSLGKPRKGQHAGFVYFESDGPILVTPSSFRTSLRGDATVTSSQRGGTRFFSCGDNRGRDVAIASITGGVRLTVTDHETGSLDHVWEIVNLDGRADRIRIRQISRLGNVMSDETFACDNGVWSKTDNVAGVRETLLRENGLNAGDGLLKETRAKYDTAGAQLDLVYTESSRIGAFGKAVLRETFWRNETGSETRWRRATYWNDPVHAARHGQVKLVWGNCIGWAYHDYDANGLETLLVEQRNGSAVPTSFPGVADGILFGAEGLVDATVTVYDYTPLAGDDGHPDDNDRVRCETRYVVRGGAATCTGRTWHRYTRQTYGGLPAVKEETWRAASADCSFAAPGNAYSSEIAFSETEAGVPLVLRGEVAEEVDEDGVATRWTYALSGNRIVGTSRREFGERSFPTYEVVERDTVFGNVVRRRICLSGDDSVIEEENSAYDEKNRLRSRTFMDGTSLTNSFSCCRLLWSSDRSGRRVLRSAETGRDRLYYANEEVWRGNLSTNGAHRVVQHFFDGLGRETNTVVYAAEVAGAATVPSASEGRRIAETSVAYPSGGSDLRIATDERGVRTVTGVNEYADRTVTTVGVFADSASQVPVRTAETTNFRGGRSTTLETWDGKWRRQGVTADYDSDGCRFEVSVVESSDCGTVTNSVTHFDFLERVVLVETPSGSTLTTYHGSSSRENAKTFASGGVSWSTTTLYNGFGEPVGDARDGVARLSETSYENVGGDWWKVHRTSLVGSVTNSCAEMRRQLTGLSPGVRRRQMDVAANGVAVETVESFDAATGLLTETTSNAVEGVSSAHSACGVVLDETTPDVTLRYGYDALGRRVAVWKRAGGDAAERLAECVAYDALGAVVARTVFTNLVAGVAEGFAYDAFGRCTRRTDPNGNATLIAYDARGNVVSRSGAEHPVRAAYDTEGRRISLKTTRDGVVWDETRWTYDSATGRTTGKQYADGSVVSFASTPDGLPLSESKASGAWLHRSYNARRNLAGTTSSDGSADAVFESDEFGRQVSASGAVWSVACNYGPNDVVTNETFAVAGRTATYRRTVDAYGRVSGRGVVGGTWQSVSYDARNRVAQLSTDDASVTYLHAPDGTDAGYVLALNGGVTVERRVVRDRFRPQLVVAVSNFVNGTAVDGVLYAHDALSRVVSRTNGPGGTADCFAYDARGQVVAATCGGVSNQTTVAYAYDEIGNFASVARAPTNVWSASANALNQYAGISYDADGCQVGWCGRTYGYDAQGHLSSVSTGGVALAGYVYDSLGRRRLKTTPGAMHVYDYDGWNLVRETVVATNGSESVVEFVWGCDLSGGLDGAGGVGGLLYAKRGADIRVPLYDANGNVLAYVDASGSVVARFAYDAFGNESTIVAPPDDGTTPFRYATKYLDAEAGLSYYGLRDCCAALGRWTTRDPLGEEDSGNLYLYCRNDPVSRYDPNGLLTAIEAFHHYLFGPVDPQNPTNRTPLSMSFDEIDTSSVGPQDFRKFRKITLQCEKGYYKMMKDFHAFSTGAPHALCLGDITLTLEGVIKIRKGGDWRFAGWLASEPDIYDFNRSDHRSRGAEALTTGGRWARGLPFKINILGRKRITASGNCCEFKRKLRGNGGSMQ